MGDAKKRLDQAYRKLYNIRSTPRSIRLRSRKATSTKLSAEDAATGAKELKEGLDELLKALDEYHPPRLFVATDSNGQAKPPAQIKEQLQPYLKSPARSCRSGAAPQSTPVPSPMQYDEQGEVVKNDEGEPKLINLDPTDRQSIARGREIFTGPSPTASVATGNRVSAMARRDFYDEWSGEWVEKNSPGATQNMWRSAHCLLATCFPAICGWAYIAADDGADIYWRIANGIDGAQMPAAPLMAEGDPPGAKNLSQRDVWDLINYVLSLPYESISEQSSVEPLLAKEIQ